MPLTFALLTSTCRGTLEGLESPSLLQTFALLTSTHTTVAVQRKAVAQVSLQEPTHASVADRSVYFCRLTKTSGTSGERCVRIKKQPDCDCPVAGYCTTLLLLLTGHRDSAGNLFTAKRRLLFDASRLFLVIPKGVLDKTFVC